MLTDSRRFRAILVSLLFLVMSLNIGSGLAEIEDTEISPPNIQVFNMVVGDTWKYYTELEVASLIDPTDPNWYGTEINQPLIGETTRTVENIISVEYKSKNYTVYEVKQEGFYTGVGTFPAPVLGLITGTMLVDYSSTLWIRVSDHATLKELTDIKIDLEHLAGVELLLDTQIDREYDTDAEYYDFPTLWNESWTQTYIQNETWNGNAAYFTPPENEKKIERAYSYKNYSAPPLIWPGCENSSYVEQTNSEGEKTKYRWFCPSIRGTVVEWTSDIILGVPAYLELVTFASGNEQNVDFRFDFNMNFDINNVTLNSLIEFNLTIILDNQTSLENEHVRINYLGEYYIWKLNNTNSVFVNFSSNINRDSTTTLYDWASHGMVVELQNYDFLTTLTITLNSSTIAEGIALRSESLDLISGWVNTPIEHIFIFGEQSRW